MDSAAIGRKIAMLRKQRNLSTTELARRTGLSQPQISRLENGKQGFRSATLERLAAALEVIPAYFFEEEREEVRQLHKREREERRALGQDLASELRAQYGDLAATPGWRQMVRKLAAAVAKPDVDHRTLRRLVDRLCGMKAPERARLLARLSGK